MLLLFWSSEIRLFIFMLKKNQCGLRMGLLQRQNVFLIKIFINENKLKEDKKRSNLIVEKIIQDS